MAVRDPKSGRGASRRSSRTVAARNPRSGHGAKPPQSVRVHQTPRPAEPEPSPSAGAAAVVSIQKDRRLRSRPYQDTRENARFNAIVLRTQSSPQQRRSAWRHPLWARREVLGVRSASSPWARRRSFRLPATLLFSTSNLRRRRADSRRAALNGPAEVRLSAPRAAPTLAGAVARALSCHALDPT